MKKAELESLLKSFFVFFLSLLSLSAILVWFEYQKSVHDFDQKLFNEMRICSFDLKCPKYEIDFAKADKNEIFDLQKNDLEIYGLFMISKNDEYFLKISLQKSNYERQIQQIQYEEMLHFLWAFLALGLISIVFSVYAMYPLRKALRLTEEFSRDILHDINTPLASIRLNAELLKANAPNDKKIERISKSADAIETLGENLKSYLEQHKNSSEICDLETILQEMVFAYEKLFPNLKYTIEGMNFEILAHKDAVSRIFDNLISNASKYNRPNGIVKIKLNKQSQTVSIEDNGRGFSNPTKIFDRYYKENNQGIGIGLHIVKKFCDEMKIKIKVTTLEAGSIFELDFSKLKKELT